LGLLAAKLILTPLLIAIATLAVHRWGPAIGGWFAGLPLTAGPVSVFLSVEQGRSFAAAAAQATLLGLVASTGFRVVYALAARRLRWPVSSALGMVSYFALILSLSAAPLGIYACIFLAYAAMSIAVFLMPAVRFDAGTAAKPSSWDLPLRMLSAAGIVWLITAIAQRVGPVWSGLLSPFPVLSTVMAAFAQGTAGPKAAIHLLRGIGIGSFAFAAFFVVVSLRVEIWSTFWTYSAALAVTLLISGISLALLAPRPGIA
jgi:hypothetical protein